MPVTSCSPEATSSTNVLVLSAEATVTVIASLLAAPPESVAVAV